MDAENWVNGRINLTINGEPLELDVTVPAEPVSLKFMLPLLRQMTESFLQIGIEKVAYEGKTISCRAGCGACCHQLVPVSEAEAVQLAGLIESFPEPRRSIVKQKFAEAKQHFSEIGWMAKLAECHNFSEREREKLVDDYFFESIPCPFLENESCSIHPDRPLACREYLVTSPAENCARPTTENIEKVRILFSIADAVYQLEEPTSKNPVNFVPLILAPEFAAENTEPSIKKTGMRWMEELIKILSKEIASKNI